MVKHDMMVPLILPQLHFIILSPRNNPSAHPSILCIHEEYDLLLNAKFCPFFLPRQIQRVFL